MGKLGERDFYKSISGLWNPIQKFFVEKHLHLLRQKMPNNDRYEYVCVFRWVRGLPRDGIQKVVGHGEKDGKENQYTGSQEEPRNSTDNAMCWSKSGFSFSCLPEQTTWAVWKEWKN